MKRIEWIDITRGMAMILIIAGHSLFNYTFSGLARMIFAVHVPIFFVLSGYLFKYKPWNKLISGLRSNILLPYFFTSFIIIVLSLVNAKFPQILGLNGYGGAKPALVAALYGVGTPTTLFWDQKFVIPAIGAIWFLLAMFVGNICFNFSLKFSERFNRSLIILFVISFICCFVGFLSAHYILLPWSINAALISQIFYWFGYTLKRYDLLSRHLLIKFIVGLGFWGISAWSGFFYVNVGAATNPVLATIGALGGSVSLIVISMFIEDHHFLVSWLVSFGKNSLLVMCMHIIDLDNLKIGGFIFKLVSHHTLPWIAVVSVIMYRIILTSLAVLIIPKIPVVRSFYLARRYPLRLKVHMKVN